MTTYERFKQSHGARLLRRGTLKFLQYALLIGLSYYILSPLLLKIATSFMTESDLLDSLVVYIPTIVYGFCVFGSDGYLGRLYSG